MNKLKVGDTAEVIEIIDNGYYTSVYKPGNTGIIVRELETIEAVMAFIGKDEPLDDDGWLVCDDDFRKVGKLTITKVK